MTKLSADQIRQSLQQLPGWQQVGDEIVKTFSFENYYETMAFVNAVAWLSHRQDHHPDLEVGYNKCKVRYSTHSVGGLSENDFACAGKIEQLMR
jgi:4a-hydroxytetrahydrobiopterin dehydratase